jgi:hypothetical protein
MIPGVHPLAIVPTAALPESESSASYDPYAGLFAAPTVEFVYLLELEVFQLPLPAEPA